MSHEKQRPIAEKENANIRIRNVRLGVWNLMIAEETISGVRKQVKDAKAALPLFKRLATDIFSVAPRLFIIYIICQIWLGIEDSILLYFSNELLRTIEVALTLGVPNKRQIVSSVLARLACSAFVSVMTWYGDLILDRLRGRVTRHFGIELLKAKLRIDLQKSKEMGSKQEATARQAWDALESVMRFATDTLRTASQLLLIVHISRSSGGPLFSLLCVAQPFFSALYRPSLWDKVCFAFTDNPHYQRIQALEKLTSNEFRQDVISNGLAPWIISEYHKANAKLGDVSDSHLYEQFEVRQTPFRGMLDKIVGDLPMAFFAYKALFDPSNFSLASIAILQQSSDNLRYSLSVAFNTGRNFRRSIASARRIYASTTVVNSMDIGNIPYPRTDETLVRVDGSKGMGFELRNVSFSYPGTQAISPALKDVSLTIEPGQLVVIVGSNGSGKSSLVRILSRLYDPSSGQMLIDGLPSSSYRIADLYASTALLSQDNLIYPLSIKENIGLGFPDYCADEGMINDAASKGVAAEVVKKLHAGMETVLECFHFFFDYGRAPFFSRSLFGILDDNTAHPRFTRHAARSFSLPIHPPLPPASRSKKSLPTADSDSEDEDPVLMASKIVTPFTGPLTQTAIETWLGQCEDGFELHAAMKSEKAADLSEITKIRLTGTLMQEPSMSAWWHGGREEYLKLATWESFKTKIKSRFMPKGYKLMALRDFFRCSQGNRSFLDFASAVADAYNNIESNKISSLAYKGQLLFHAHELLTLRIMAMPNLDLEKTSFDDLVVLMAMQWDSLVAEGSVRPTSGRVHVIGNPAILPSREPLTDAEKEKLKAVGGCWRCRKTPQDPGWTEHKSNNCPGDAAQGIPPGRNYVPPSSASTVKREAVGFVQQNGSELYLDDDTDEEEAPARHYAGAALAGEPSRLAVPDPEQVGLNEDSEDEYSFYDITPRRS